MAKHNPIHGKRWIALGLIRSQDKSLVMKKMQHYKIPIKIGGNQLHKEGDPRRKQFQEIYVGRGHRREAMKVMNVLFAAPTSDPEEVE